MVIEAADGPGLNAWYGDEVGMAAVRRVVGPFRLTVPLRVMHKLGSDLALTNPYNAAGVYIGLNPTVYSPGGQSYVVYNVGFQESSIAREVKSTVPNPGGESLSSLYLNAHDGATPIEVELRACRIGPYFEFHWRPIGASDWNQEVRTFDTVRLGNGEDVLPPETDTGTPMVFYRPDLDLPTGPLYVGVMLNAWEYDGAEKQTRAEYEAVTYEGIQPGDSCVD